MPGEPALPSAADFGLDDPSMLETAIRLGGHLFGVLKFVAGADWSYPVETVTALAGAVSGSLLEGRFEGPGVGFDAETALREFPDEFLPITDRQDLARKMYLVVAAAHHRSSEEFRARHQGKGDLGSSHPLPEVLV